MKCTLVLAIALSALLTVSEARPWFGRSLKKSHSEHTKCRQINKQHCNNAGICTMTVDQCCGKRCMAAPPPPPMDVMADAPTMDYNRQLFNSHAKFLDRMETRRLKKSHSEHTDCRQINRQHCSNAGICTMTTTQCCGKRCAMAPPPPPPPPAMDAMETVDESVYDRQLFVVRDSFNNRRLKKKKTKISTKCTQKNVNHCSNAGICTMTTTQCCGGRCSPPPPPPPPPPAMDLMDTYPYGRRLFAKRIDRRLRKKKTKISTKCTQENVNHCNNAGICTMTTTQCCGDRCSPPPPPPPPMDAMEDEIHRQLFVSHNRFLEKMEHRRLRKKSTEISTKCRQENVNYCDNAGICTITSAHVCN